MSEQAHVDAVLALLNEALAPKRAYEVDSVPSPRPAEYVEVQIARVLGGSRRINARKMTDGYRITVYGISQTHAANARLMLDKARAAVEYARIQIGGAKTTPVQFEVADPVRPDDGWLSGWADYTYTITT